MATGGGCQPDGNSDSLKSSARPNNTWFINTRLMSSEPRQWERAVRPREPEHSHLLPVWSGLASIVLIVNSFFTYAGVEVNAVHVDELRDPGREFP